MTDQTHYQQYQEYLKARVIVVEYIKEKLKTQKSFLVFGLGMFKIKPIVIKNENLGKQRRKTKIVFEPSQPIKEEFSDCG